MALDIVPYNNAMRLGQGFNSFTQQIAVDNAVVGISDPEDTQPLAPGRGLYAPIAGDNTTEPVVSDPNKKTLKEIKGIDDNNAKNDNTETTKFPSQIVTYSTKYVSKLSDVSNDMNVSGSLSIKYGEISGGGSGSYVNTETFQNSDLNFLVTVKVINQTINVKDQLQFWPLSADAIYEAADFTRIYGDSFISGFQEGGQFSAIVSIRALDSSNLTSIKANAHLALQVGVASVDGSGDFKMEKQALNKESEINITVNWSGGGKLKASDKPWTIETLQEVAAKFPDLVADDPQRTHAILTKYTALRSFLQWRASAKLEPLNYDVANLYTGELLDVYMGYKTIWKLIHETLDELDGDNPPLLVKAPALDTEVRMPRKLLGDKRDKLEDGEGELLKCYEPNFVGLDQALKDARRLMVRIVDENEIITRDPMQAVNADRPIAYLRPQVFKQLLPYEAPLRSLSVKLYPEAVNIPAETSSLIKYPGGKQTVVPTVITALSRVDMIRKDERQIGHFSTTFQWTYQHAWQFSTRPDDDTAHTTIWPMTAQTLMIPANDEGIQGGKWTMPVRESDSSHTSDWFATTETITFKYPYDIEGSPPSVVVFLTGFDIEAKDDQVVFASAENIRTSDFKLTVRGPRSLRTIDVTWFACSSNSPNIVCGTSKFQASTGNGVIPWTDVAKLPRSEEGFSDHVQFGRRFTKPPRMFQGLRAFVNNDPGENNRVQSVVTDITKRGFNWKIDGWVTRLAGGTFSWIAWQD